MDVPMKRDLRQNAYRGHRGTPTTIWLTAGIVRSPTECAVASSNAPAKYKSRSFDGTDTDRITLMPQ